MEKRTIIDQIEITKELVVQIRMHKQILDDDGITVINSSNHRTSVEPGFNMLDVLHNVNTHLNSMGWPSIDQNEWNDRIVSVTNVIWTNEVVSEWNAKRAALEAAQAPNF